MKEKAAFLECGTVINTHGVRGGMKIDSLCDTPDILASLSRVFLPDGNGGFTEVKIRSASVMKRFVIMTLAGIDDIDGAERMRGATLYAAREDMPLEDGDFFIVDLVGLPVIDADDGHEYGVISDVFNAGASDIYTVHTPDGDDRMIPAVPEFIIRIDTETGVFIRPIGGMFD